MLPKRHLLPLIGFCLLLAVAFTAYAEEGIVGTVRLKENRLIFQAPATLKNSTEFVSVTCPPHNGGGTITTNSTYPHVVAQTGQELTVLDILPCSYHTDSYFLGPFVHVRTAKNILGYTQLPNYHTLIQTTDAEGAFKILYLNMAACGNDPDCQITQFAEPFHRFIKSYPTSRRVSQAAEVAAKHYGTAAASLQRIAANPTFTSREFSSHYAKMGRETLLAKAMQYAASKAEMQALIAGKPTPPPAPQQNIPIQQPTAQSAPAQTAPQQTASSQPNSPNLNDRLVQQTKLPEPSKPAQPIASVQQTSPPLPASRNSFASILIGCVIGAAIAYYVVKYSSVRRETDHRSSQPAPVAADRENDAILTGFKVVISTIAAVFMTHYGHQAMGIGFVFFTWWFVPLPWVYLVCNWRNLSKRETWDHDSMALMHIGHLVAGIVPPVLLLLSLSVNFSFHAALVILFGANTLLCWYLYLTRADALRAEDAKRQDTERKQKLIAALVRYAAPLSRLLSRYHPAWYPPPINHRLEMLIAKYATFLRDLDKANGKHPSNAPDDALIRSPCTQRSFPDSWDFETTIRFCRPLIDIFSALQLCAEFTLQEQTQYEAELTAIFESTSNEEALKAEDRLPPHLREKIYRVTDKIPLGSAEIEQEVEHIATSLTALIPDYVAQHQTVIGMPKDDVPVAYQSLESRFYHTFLIGRSGRGKSTTITNIVAQDMHKGYGVIVVSPDQDLMTRIVPYIPEHRLDDVIYFDPSDTTPPTIGFNPFFFEPPDNPREYDLQRTRKAGEIYSVLERTLEIDTEPTKRLLNNAMFALTGRPTVTINDLSRLIDPKERAFHAEIAHDTRVDSPTREFWRTYATEGANAMVYRNLQGRMIDLLRPPLFDIFSTQSFSFHRELNEHSRILLIDLSNFSRDSREAKITAQLLIAMIQQTMLRRDKMPKSRYLPYFMYIDEFQNFADTNERSISAMTEQLRKYSFGLTLTSLVASDLSTRLFDTIIGVMSTFICLSISAKDAGRFASEMSVKRADRDAFNPEALQKLQVGQAYVLTPPLDAAIFVQIPREPPGKLPTLPTTIDDLKNRSKANFGAMATPEAPTPEHEHTATEQEAEKPASRTRQSPPQPKQTTRRRRKRFEDEESSEIEVC